MVNGPAAAAAAARFPSLGAAAVSALVLAVSPALVTTRALGLIAACAEEIRW